MTTLNLILTNKAGLHARPAAELIKAAAKYESKVVLEGKGKSADAKSIFKVLSLSLQKGDSIKITADGPDEKKCIEDIKNLITNEFFE